MTVHVKEAAQQAVIHENAHIDTLVYLSPMGIKLIPGDNAGMCTATFDDALLEKKNEKIVDRFLVDFSWLPRLFCAQLSRRPFASVR